MWRLRAAPKRCTKLTAPRRPERALTAPSPQRARRLVEGTNRIELRQEKSAGWIWGVGRLALFELGVGFGNLWSLRGDTEHKEGITLYLPGNGAAQLLTLRGYDVDQRGGEVELMLNGERLGLLPKGPDRSWSASARLYLPTSKLRRGVNVIKARNILSPNYDWGLAFDALTPGNAELGRFPGGESGPGDTNKVTYLVPTFASDRQINLRFFDVDWGGERVSIFLDRGFIREANKTLNNRWGNREPVALSDGGMSGDLRKLKLTNSHNPPRRYLWGVKFEGWK